MSKKTKSVKPSPMLAAQPAPIVEAPVVEAPKADAPLTKRNRVASSAVLQRTDKKVSDRADHNKLAWDTLTAILPATAAALVEELDKAIKAGTVPSKIVPSTYVSYMIRRGALAAKAD